MANKDEIIEIAKQCFDPEIPVNIWDLGLIYDIDLTESGDCNIRMSLTSQHCPAAQSLPDDLKNRILKSGKVKTANVQVVFDPPWTPERISEEGKKKLGIDESL